MVLQPVSLRSECVRKFSKEVCEVDSVDSRLNLISRKCVSTSFVGNHLLGLYVIREIEAGPPAFIPTTISFYLFPACGSQFDAFAA